MVYTHPLQTKFMRTEREHRQEIVYFGKQLYDRCFVAATDGNISVRLGHDRLLCTPTGMSKGMMRDDDCVIVNSSGMKLSGHREVSSEIAMHLLIYRMRSDVNAIVHAHPPTATGYAAAGMALDKALVSEIVLSLGSVPLARYATPGTPALCDSLEPHIAGHNAILMANHGVVAYADDLHKAYMNMETVEHFAKIALVTHQLGSQQVLSAEDVEKLMEVRQRYHVVSNALTTPTR
jgi:L-fuculose-phosphate aldolase